MVVCYPSQQGHGRDRDVARASRIGNLPVHPAMPVCSARAAAQGLMDLYKGLGSFLLSAAIFIGKIVLQCVKPLWLLVRWMFRPLILPIWERLGMTERLHRIKEKVFSGIRRMNQWVVSGRAKVARLLRLFHHRK